jgi:hypothetical protein
MIQQIARGEAATDSLKKELLQILEEILQQIA